MGDKTRVYSDKVDVSGDSIRDFYDKRATAYKAGEKSSNTVVLLGDNNPDYADKWNEFEKKTILPRLNLTKGRNVLDIGCGVGRWGESVIPLCGKYRGVDFSGGMVKVASERFAASDNALFKQASFLDLFEDKDIIRENYDAVIIAGVSMYINDEILGKCYEKLPGILNSGATVYIEESIGVKERLTLNGIWSEALKSDYNAIYRTREEYRHILAPMLAVCNVLEDDYFNVLDKKDLSETSHWYTILEMK